MRILLVRHGQTHSNILGLLDSGAPGPGLTDLGKRQAHGLVDALATTEIASIHVSTLVRTQETAEPLASKRKLTPVVHDRLREIAAGDLEMRSDKVSFGTYLDTVMGWAEGALDRRLPGGPSGHEFYQRFDGVLADIEAAEIRARDRGDWAHRRDADGATVVVVSHGAAIRVWAAGRCENLVGSDAAERDLHNTGMVLIERAASAKVAGPGGRDVERPWRMVEWTSEPVRDETPNRETDVDPTGAGR